MWILKTSQLADKVAFHCLSSLFDNLMARCQRSTHVFAHFEEFFSLCVNRFQFSNQPKCRWVVI